MGYVYQHHNGDTMKLLTRDYVWYEHDRLEDGFVHNLPPAEVRLISYDWQFKPTHYYEAVYENGEMRIVSKRKEM